MKILNNSSVRKIKSGFNRDDVPGALKQIEATYKYYLKYFSCKLNEYNSLNWSVSQYEVLIGAWLYQFIHIIYARYNCIEAAGIISREDSNIINIGDYNWSPWMQCERSNSLLYKQINLIIEGKDISKLIELPNSEKSIKDFKCFHLDNKVLIYDPYLDFNLKVISRNRIIGKAKQMLSLSKLLPIAGPVKFAKRLEDSCIDWRWRLGLDIGNKNDFIHICEILCKFYMPMSFLENFKTLYCCSRDSKIKCLYSANALWHSIPYKMIAASNPNIKLLSHQHGSGYGLDTFQPGEYYERRVSDIFYTWGWSEDSKTKPLPSAPRIISKRGNKRKGVLVKCNNFPRYTFRIHYVEMGTQGLELIDKTMLLLKLISKLNPQIALYRYDYGWQVEKRFQEKGVSMNKQTKQDSEYMIYVYNYPGTGFLETLAANLPTVCFYDPNIYSFRKASLAYINELHTVGILHFSPQSAAEKVNSISEDADSWWFTTEVQNARKKFVSKYARLEDTYIESWREEFECIGMK